MRVLRNSVSNKLKEEIIDMTDAEIVNLLLSGLTFIVVESPSHDSNYDLNIQNYDGFVE